jgi:peptidyl-prolyl cis-trans isomerase D
MMDVFRRAAKSWLAKVLIGVLAMSFGVWGIADVFRGYHGGALATVGTQEIEGTEFTQSLTRTLQNINQQTGQSLSVEDARRMGIDRQVLNNLIQSAAVDDQVRKLKLGIADSLIAAETAANPAFKGADGNFDKQEFLRILERNGMNEQMYLASERRQRLRQAISDAVDGDFATPKAMVDALYRDRNEQRDARYFVVKTADSEVTAPTDTEIDAQYKADPKAYTAPEYRTVAVITVAPADIAKKQTVSDDELKAGYEKYKADYFTPEKRTILQLTFPSLDEAKAAKDRIAAGTDFLAVAKERGVPEADATFADKVKTDFFDPAVADAAFSLPVGAVSDPIKGSFAVTLLKIVKVAPESQQSLDQVKPTLTERLQLEKALDEVQSVYNAVEDARAANTKFEDIASRAGLPFQLVGPVDQNGRGKDGKDLTLPHAPELLKAAFGSDVGVENDAISIEDGYIWYEVREVVPSAVKPLADVKDQVVKDIMASKVRLLSLQKVKALAERARTGATLEDLAKENAATIQTATGLKRNETSADFDAAAVQALFAVPENGFAYALEGDGRGAKVIQSSAVLLPPFDATSEEAKTIGDQLKQAMGGDVLAAYLGALQTKAGVSINDELWRQISGTQTQQP